MMQRIHVSILSDSRLFREAISWRLALEDAVELLGAAGTVDELLASAQARPIEVVLVHSSTELAEAVEFVWDVKTRLPEARVIALGAAQSEAVIVKCIEAGASAYLEHHASYPALVQTIQAVFHGRTTCSVRILNRVMRRIGELAQTRPDADECEPKRLSFRETEVARLMALGLINKQIARRLGIKPLTVKNHVHNLLQKLRVKRRRDVVGRVYEHKSIED